MKLTRLSRSEIPSINFPSSKQQHMGNVDTTQRIDRAHRTGILSLSELKLQQLPAPLLKEFQDATSTLAPLIKSLDLSANRFVSLPPELGHLSQLRLLNVSNNRISEITERHITDIFHQLEKLEQLDLRFNRLCVLPMALFLPSDALRSSETPLTHLRQLLICNNKLKAIPDSIGLLKSLVVLDASHNEITEIPTTLSQLAATLEEVNFASNKIEVVPEDLALLQKLASLQLSRNKISAFPGSIFKRTRVKTVNLEDNPILVRQLMEVDGYQEVSCLLYSNHDDGI